MRDLLTLESPLLVPNYTTQDEYLPILRKCEKYRDTMRHKGIRPEDRIVPTFCEAEVTNLLPPGTRLGQGWDGSYAMGNIYGRDYFLAFHPDISVTSDVRCIIGLHGRGHLSFWKQVDGEPRPNAVSSNARIWKLPIHPGDAIFWTEKNENDGWLHGGHVGERISLVLRFDVIEDSALDGSPEVQ